MAWKRASLLCHIVRRAEENYCRLFGLACRAPCKVDARGQFPWPTSFADPSAPCSLFCLGIMPRSRGDRVLGDCSLRKALPTDIAKVSVGRGRRVYRQPWRCICQAADLCSGPVCGKRARSLPGATGEQQQQRQLWQQRQRRRQQRQQEHLQQRRLCQQRHIVATGRWVRSGLLPLRLRAYVKPTPDARGSQCEADAERA